MGHPSMPRWRYTVTDPVPTHLMCTAKIDTISITAKNKHPNTKALGCGVLSIGLPEPLFICKYIIYL